MPLQSRYDFNSFSGDFETKGVVCMHAMVACCTCHSVRCECVLLHAADCYWSHTLSLLQPIMSALLTAVVATLPAGSYALPVEDLVGTGRSLQEADEHSCKVANEHNRNWAHKVDIDPSVRPPI